MPTPAIKRGDMSGSPLEIYDPLTGNAAGAGRVPFANKQVPLNRIDPIAGKIVPLIPTHRARVTYQ